MTDSSTRTRLDGGDAILEALRNLDVDYIISSPGSEWPSVWEALARQKVNEQPGPAYINCWHETLAVAMASGYTRMTGRMQAVLLHAGVGVMQGSMGIHGAYQSEVPMLVCSGESSTYGEVPEMDPGPQWLRNLSIVGGPNRLVEPFTKWSSRVTDSSVLYETVARAGELAQRTPMGPAFLNVPIETMLEEWSPSQSLKRRHGTPVSPPDPAAIARVADLLCRAENPVIVADSAGRSPEGFNALVSLAESRGIPVFEGEGPTYNNFPKSHPLHHGYDLKREMDRFDLFLIIGNRAPWYPPSAGPSATVVVIDDYPIKEYMVHQDLQADMYLEGTLPTTLQALDAAVRERSGNAPPALPPHQNPVWERYSTLGAGSDTASPIDPGFLCNTISETLPSNTVFVDETILHRAQILRRIAGDNPLSYMRPAGGLGQGLGIALGAKLAAPDRPVTALIGDGSFLYNPITQSLGVARESNLPILIVVFNNASYAAMKSLHHSFYPEGTAVQTGIYHGVDIPGPDYSELAKPFGGHGERVEDPSRLNGALLEAQAAVDSGRVAIVDVVLSA